MCPDSIPHVERPKPSARDVTPPEQTRAAAGAATSAAVPSADDLEDDSEDKPMTDAKDAAPKQNGVS